MKRVWLLRAAIPKNLVTALQNQETVVIALKGTPAVAVVAGTEVPFTIRASHPVMHEGKLVGSVSIGTSWLHLHILTGSKSFPAST